MKYIISLLCQKKESDYYSYLEREIYEIEDHEVATEIFYSLVKLLERTVKKL